MFATGQSGRQWLRLALAGVVMVAISACATIYRNHGYVPTDEELAEVVVGIDTRDSVAESVGAPSASGMLADGDYYYVSTRIRHYGALEPKVVNRRIVAISFDQAGVVENVEEFGLEHGRVVRLQRRVTSSSVSDKTFFRQLLGNLGNINPGQIFE